MLNYFRLKKGRATFFRPETIVASFLHSMVLLPKLLFKHYCLQQLQLSHLPLFKSEVHYKFNLWVDLTVQPNLVIFISLLVRMPVGFILGEIGSFGRSGTGGLSRETENS